MLESMEAPTNWCFHPKKQVMLFQMIGVFFRHHSMYNNMVIHMHNRRSFMNANTRRTKILEQLNVNGSVQVTHLAEQFEISEVTIRTDLRILEEQGYISRYHGGANVSSMLSARPVTKSDSETILEDRLSIAQTPKSRIAQEASSLVFPGASVILDSGSTTLLIAEELVKLSDITVITNSLPAANILSENKDITLVLCGGTLRHKTRSMHGSIAETALLGVTADFLFIGADGIDPVNGITTFNEGYAISAVMANAAKSVVAVVDSTKFGRSGFNQVLKINQIHSLITDDGIEENARIELINSGLNVVIV